MSADKAVAATARVTSKTKNQTSADTGDENYLDISLNDILEILTDFDVEELETLQKNVEVAKVTVEKRKRAEAIEDAEKAAQKHGFSLGDLLQPKDTSTPGTKGKKKPMIPGVPKYKHPENPTITWTGKGRKPAWVNDHLEKGGKIEDLEI